MRKTILRISFSFLFLNNWAIFGFGFSNPKEAINAISSPATEIRLVEIQPQEDQSTNVILSGNGTLRYHMFELNNPSRLVIDLESVRLAPAVPRVLTDEKHVISRVRLAQYTVSPGVVRAVIDLNRKVTYKAVLKGCELLIHLSEVADESENLGESAETKESPERVEGSNLQMKTEIQADKSDVVRESSQKTASGAISRSTIEDIGQQTPLSKPSPTPPAAAKQNKHWSFEANFSNVYDSNINQDVTDLESVGIVYGAAVHFQTQASHPVLQLEYTINRHTYSETDRWDRISQDMDAIYELRLTKNLSIQTEGEISLKGSTEDHEIANQYIFRPEINYRVYSSGSIGFYGAYRLKHYPIELGRDAQNNYLGLEWEQKLGAQELEVGFRYDRNKAENPRYNYIRWTYNLKYTIPFKKSDNLFFQLTYRPQHYGQRLVEVGDEDVLRFDKRWVFISSSSFALADHLDLQPRYKYESRSSNDPEKEFGEHRFSVNLRYHW